ncbi:MAG: hypothetical protein IJE92_01220 [Clostridia bacterium]|nr:hypothetical protein [Clostridia bacterium]
MDEQQDLNAIQAEIEKRKTGDLSMVVDEQPPAPQLKPVNVPTAFTDVVDKAKISTITDVAATDKRFVREFTDQITDAALVSAKVEQERQRLEKQAVEYEQELLETKQQLNKLEQQTNKWEKRQKRRQFFYDGVKPIMMFVDIKEPMNILLTLVMTIIIFPFFLVSKFVRGTIGNLLSGATDDTRPKAVKNFLWTILALTVVLVLAFVVFLVLKHYGIINIIQGGESGNV